MNLIDIYIYDRQDTNQDRTYSFVKHHRSITMNHIAKTNITAQNSARQSSSNTLNDVLCEN